MVEVRKLEMLPEHPVPAGLPAVTHRRLQVDGAVQESLDLSVDEVLALGARVTSSDFVCEEGWMIPELRWEGVPVAVLLQRAGLSPEARFLRVYAGDFTVLLPLAEVLAGCALLAHRLNGAPLTPEHGAPLRLVAPGRACYYSVKWVDRLEALAQEAPTTGETIALSRLGRSAPSTVV